MPHAPGSPDPAASLRPAAPAPGTSADMGAEVLRFEQSLRAMRALMALCLAVPLALYAGLGVYRWQQIHDSAERRLDRLLQVAREHALKILEGNDAISAHALSIGQAAGPVPREREPSIHAQLSELSAGKPQLQSIFLIGRNARPIASDRVFPVPQADLSALDYVQWHRSGTRPTGTFFTGLNIGRVTGEPYFATSRAVYGKGGMPELIALVSLKPVYFSDFHATLAQGEPGLTVTMFRADGAVYSRWPAVQAPPAPVDEPVLTQVGLGQQRGALRSDSPTAGDRLVHFQQVGAYPVYLATKLQLSAIRAQWLREMAVIAGFSALPVAALVLAAFMALRRTREVLESTRRLHEESQARRHVEDALLQSQKLEALGRLTGGVAHDFNNALMVISGNVHLLRALGQPGTARFTDAIGRAVDSATNLTRQLLAFSRRQPLLPQAIRLQERLPPLKDLLAPVLGSQVQLSIEVDADTPPIEVDVAEFELGLINLAVNARDAMPKGGTFTVCAHRSAPPAAAGVDDAPDWVEVEVSDSGSGIPPEVLPKVFEPFYTTKPVGQGTGLGLSQVYALCRRSRGFAAIESTVGRGTTLHLFFPAAARQADVAKAGGSAAPRKLGLDVLLVEDNQEVALAVKPVLEMLGCTVRHQSRADEALPWLAQQQALPDVLLTDVIMPGRFDGLVLAREVRARYPRVRIIVMTGYSEQLEAISALGFTVLPKPWSAERLAELLEAGEAEAQTRSRA